MDDPHGSFSYNRKRKAETDEDGSDIVVDALLVEQPGACTTSACAPRQPCLAPGVIWHSSTTPHAILGHPSKRPRHDIQRPVRRPARKFPASLSPARPPPTDRCGSDVEDIGTPASATDPGPSTGSLLSLRGPPKQQSPVLLAPSFHFTAHIPPLLPLINRQSLKELDLDVILRNPQLRHDLLFDSGLQFRPTGSKRKKELSEKYWAAVITELDTGCTCISFNSRNKPDPTVTCACQHIPLPSDAPVSTVSPSLGITTIRMPSRIRPLLTEFLHVLITVLQPLSSISRMYVNPGSFKHQVQEHSEQASHIRSIFDPALIEQELRHRVFDPSGLFRAIGTTLKAHCAPMRDQALEAMMRTAEDAVRNPSGQASRSESIKALRQCMDILELMKLDIANHQIQRLQPHLKRSAPHWELKTFKAIQQFSSYTLTREWIWRAHSSMLSWSNVLIHPSYPDGLSHRKLNRNQQLYIATLKGLTDLVFTPPIQISPSSLPSPSATPPIHPTTPLPGYPETFYLDNSRLVLLSADISDLTALYMFLLLYRQLLCSTSGVLNNTRVDPSVLAKLKNEIRDIGSSRLGHCFLSLSSGDNDDEQWRRIRHDVVLQIAMRAKESQSKSCRLSLSSSSIGHVPDERTLNLAQKWADLNIQPASPLSNLLRDRLRDVVFSTVVAMSYPGRDSSVGKLSNEQFLTILGCNLEGEVPSATGMEPLAEEIHSLAEKISRLALVHLDAFLPLYEHPNFLELMA